jgi:hypothetical protein
MYKNCARWVVLNTPSFNVIGSYSDQLGTNHLYYAPSTPQIMLNRKRKKEKEIGVKIKDVQTIFIQGQHKGVGLLLGNCLGVSWGTPVAHFVALPVGGTPDEMYK